MAKQARNPDFLQWLCFKTRSFKNLVGVPKGVRLDLEFGRIPEYLVPGLFHHAPSVGSGVLRVTRRLADSALRPLSGDHWIPGAWEDGSSRNAGRSVPKTGGARSGRLGPGLSFAKVELPKGFWTGATHEVLLDEEHHL